MRENSYSVFFFLALGFKNCSLLALTWIPEDKGFLFPFFKSLETHAPFKDLCKCVAYILMEISNWGSSHVTGSVCPGSSWLGWPAATNPCWLASQPFRRPVFQHKWCPNQHIPMEYFKFQQSNIFLWRSLLSERSLLALSQTASCAQGPAAQ